MPREIVEIDYEGMVEYRYDIPRRCGVRIKERTNSFLEKSYILQYRLFFIWFDAVSFGRLITAEKHLKKHQLRSKPTSKVIKHE